MRDLVELRQFWQENKGRELTLCTLIRKQDFGYRAVGARKIVRFDGQGCGLLSGGCLEGDINRTATDQWQKMPFVKSFSTMDEGERFFGYQAGCPGIIDILFEEIPPDADIDLYLPFGEDQKAEGVVVTLNDGQSTHRRFGGKTEEDHLFFDPWVKPINLFIIGCGPDAGVFAELAKPMGWNLRFLDYRGNFRLAEKYAPYSAEIFPLDDIATQIPEGERQAVVLMTHNYEADMTLFSHLLHKKIGYLGCLGPRRRYEQLKADLLKTRQLTVDAEWEKIVFAPAGLFVSGRAPEEIALSIIAQIQSIMKSHDRK